MTVDANGALPKGWAMAALGDISQPTRPRHVPIDYPDLPFIGMEHIEAHTMRLLRTVLSSTMKSRAVHFWPGDVLYGRLRPYLNKVYRPDFEGLCSGEFIVLPANQHVDNRYLKYLLNSAAFVSFASHLNEGDRPRIDFGQIAEYPFPLPPLAEQRRIVAAIEQQFTRLDAAVASLRRARANLTRYRATVLQAAVSGRIVPTEDELARTEGRRYESAAQLLERILHERQHRKKAGPSTKSRVKVKATQGANLLDNTEVFADSSTRQLPLLPAGWARGVWNQISEWVTYGFTRPMPHVEGGIAIVTAKSIANGRIDLTRSHMTTWEAYLQLSEKDRPRPGDILITKDGTIGRAAVVETERPFCINQSVAVVWLRNCPISRRFLLRVIESPSTQLQVIAKARGVAIKHLSITDFAALDFPLPPLEEQHRIVAEIDRRFSIVDDLEVTIDHSLKRAERVRQAILKRAFAGELVPQDPSNEPASVLLERIRAERAAHELVGKQGNRKRGRAGQREHS